MSKSSRRRSRQKQARRSRYQANLRRDPVARATSRHDYFAPDFQISAPRKRRRSAQQWATTSPTKPMKPSIPRLHIPTPALKVPGQRQLRRALICARRKIRREVLFSSGRTGSGNRAPRFGRNSKVEC